MLFSFYSLSPHCTLVSFCVMVQKEKILLFILKFKGVSVFLYNVECIFIFSIFQESNYPHSAEKARKLAVSWQLQKYPQERQTP